MALQEQIIDNYKIVFLGDTNVGKTSFVQTLKALIHWYLERSVLSWVVSVMRLN